MAGNADRVFIYFDLGTERFHASECAVTIRGCCKMAQLAGALGKRGNHCVAMRDRFVARRLNATGELLRWLDRALFHAAILAWGLGEK